MEKRVEKKCNLKKKKKQQQQIYLYPTIIYLIQRKKNRYNMEGVQASQNNHWGLKKIGQP